MYRVLLCAQDTAQLSWNAGVTRMIVTLATLLICKGLQLPCISAGIGCVTFISVVLTKPGL